MEMPTKKPIYAIAACSTNRVIGAGGKLPWRIKEDLQHLYQSVKNGVVIEGRRVYDELGKAYPETKTIVLTRDNTRSFPDAQKAGNLPEAIEMAQAIEGFPTIWIGGGQTVYEEALSICDRLYLTLVDTEVQGDTFFPEWRQRFKRIVSDRPSTNGKLHYRFLVLEP
jgi:dihydrofolate reductase